MNPQTEPDANSYQRMRNRELLDGFDAFDFGGLCAAVKDAFVFSTTALPPLGDLFDSLAMNTVQDAVENALANAMQEQPQTADSEPGVLAA